MTLIMNTMSMGMSRMRPNEMRKTHKLSSKVKFFFILIVQVFRYSFASLMFYSTVTLICIASECNSENV